MSDGTELEPLPDDLRALIEAEKGGGEPPGASRERVLWRLVGTFTLSAPAGYTGKAPPASAGRARDAAHGAPPLGRGARAADRGHLF